MAMVRSVLAIVAGLAVFTLLLVGASAVGGQLAGGAPEWMSRGVTRQIVWLAWNIVSMMGAGYVAAAVARRAPVVHAVVMGGIQAIFTLAAMMTVTDTATPHWLWIGGIVSTMPAAWLGARLRA